MLKVNISIIVPCYNHSEYLNEALFSVFNQKYENWECIIVDDGSVDDTKIVASEWLKKDDRFSYIYQENKGLSSARNKGISEAEGEIILPLDADDKISENYLFLANNTFKKNKNVKVVYAEAEKFGVISERWLLEDFSLFNLSRNNMIFCSAFFKKSDWKRIGGYDENMVYGWEDWEFWISLLKNGGEVIKLNEVCFFYRIKENSMLTSIDKTKGDYLLNYLNVKHADFFVKQYGTFQELNKKNILLKEKFNEQLNSEKFVIDVFCSKFFGFSVFGKFKRKN